MDGKGGQVGESKEISRSTEDLAKLQTVTSWWYLSARSWNFPEQCLEPRAQTEEMELNSPWTRSMVEGESAARE